MSSLGMVPDLIELDAAIDSWEVDAYLLYATGSDANQRYLSGFGAPDPFHTIYRDGEIHLLVRGLERGHAEETSRATSVSTPADFDRESLIEEVGTTAADHRVLGRFLREHGVEAVAVPETFPIGYAEGLRDQEVPIHVDHDDVIQSIRAIKTTSEIEAIEHAQRATEQAMEGAEHLLRDAEIVDDRLELDGEVLTSERIKEAMEITLLRHRCEANEIIVASGKQASDPHNRGSGPIQPHSPIVIDVFPQHRDSKYHADMTRTFCVGEPTDTAATWYDLVLEAQQAAFDTLGPGVTGEAVHNAVCDVFEAHGIQTLRTNESASTGFFHGTGHGIGLEVHESPRLSTRGEELKPGHVVTVEPGLYDPDVGGIRIEDLVVITEDGYRNLTSYDTHFIP